jgi:hypothetical protein
MAQALDTGRLTRRALGGVDAAVALSALGGTLLSLVELRFARPDLDGDEAAVNLAEMVLRMLGAPPDDAHDVVRRPLPDLS